MKLVSMSLSTQIIRVQLSSYVRSCVGRWLGFLIVDPGQLQSPASGGNARFYAVLIDNATARCVASFRVLLCLGTSKAIRL